MWRGLWYLVGNGRFIMVESFVNVVKFSDFRDMVVDFINDFM